MTPSLHAVLHLCIKTNYKAGMRTGNCSGPCLRKYHGLLVERTPESKKLDLDLSEAPSMTACGQLGIDRTFVPVPGEKNLYFLYNKYQEEWHLQNDKEEEGRGCSRDPEPTVSTKRIPEML